MKKSHRKPTFDIISHYISYYIFDIRSYILHNIGFSTLLLLIFLISYYFIIVYS